MNIPDGKFLLKKHQVVSHKGILLFVLKTTKQCDTDDTCMTSFSSDMKVALNAQRFDEGLVAFAANIGYSYCKTAAFSVKRLEGQNTVCVMYL